MFFIMLLDERRDAPMELVYRLYKWKVADAFKRTQSGLWELDAAKVFAKVSVRCDRGCVGGNRTSGGCHQDQMGQRLWPPPRVLERQEAAVRVTEERKLL